MRPRFGPVLPRMTGGIGADEPLLPIGRRPALIVALQGLLVIGALVAKHLAERLEARTVLDQSIPVVMADLMAKVTQQRPVLLVLQLPLLLPADIVGFGHIDRDEAVVMPRQDPFAITTGRVLQKMKFDPRVV